MSKSVRALLLVLFAAATVILVVAVSRPNGKPLIPEAELARLVGRARLSWADYGEGIKAALGATPAAQWHGAPVEVRLAESSIKVHFSVGVPWNEYAFGFPILLRDPEGRVATPVKYERTATGGVYTFRHEGTLTPLAVPWVELRYPPNEEQRVIFDATGVWRKSGGA